MVRPAKPLYVMDEHPPSWSFYNSSCSKRLDILVRCTDSPPDGTNLLQQGNFHLSNRSLLRKTPSRYQDRTKKTAKAGRPASEEAAREARAAQGHFGAAPSSSSSRPSVLCAEPRSAHGGEADGEPQLGQKLLRRNRHAVQLRVRYQPQLPFPHHHHQPRLEGHPRPRPRHLPVV